MYEEYCLLKILFKTSALFVLYLIVILQTT